METIGCITPFAYCATPTTPWLGDLSTLAGIDLHSGQIFANVADRHRSLQFIALLKRLDEHYPQGAIRAVLNNHSAHIYKETMAYLATRPGRFECVHTPKYGS